MSRAVTGVLEAAHNAAAHLVRHAWGYRGGSRLARAVRAGYLSLGGTHLVTANLRDGSCMLVDMRAGNEWPTFYLGEYDDFCVDLCLRAMDEGGTFLDVGANIGLYSVRVARRMPAGCKVHSFEPLPENAQRLTQNLEMNGVAGRVEIHCFGLSDDECAVELKLRGPASSGAPTGNAAIVIGDGEDCDLPGLQIRLQRLDSLAANGELGRIDAIKVDIEGHEDKFFAGGRETLANWRPVILAEWLPAYFRRRGIDAESAYGAALPDHYRFLLVGEDRRLRLLNRLSEAGELANVLICPQEKIERLMRGNG